MAIDEALLQAVEQGQSQPILRLYSWQPPTLSLGYSQPYADVDLSALKARGWGLVRRPTGGRAILHTDELTYAVILPLDHPLAAGGVLASYQRLSKGLLLALQQLGLAVEIEQETTLTAEARSNPVCFEVPSAYELTVQGKKLIGSAQTRRRRAMLQHGSLPLHGDLSRICQVLHFETKTARRKAQHRLLERAGTVENLLNRRASWEEANQALQNGFSQAFQITWERDELSAAEQEAVEYIASNRYRKEEWTERL